MSMSTNIHATGRYEPVTFHVEPLGVEGKDLLLSLATSYNACETADVSIFLSPETARSLAAALAGYLGLVLEEKS